MANYIVTYDLNGPQPTHAQMDAHLKGFCSHRARILETVWYVGFAGTQQQLIDHIKQIVRPEDLVLVIDARSATWTKLLIKGDWLIEAWKANA